MSNVFYRKYRPHTFSEIQGQEHVKQVLVNSILNDSITHGYLFTGPRGTGKTSMARVFAKAVNSENFKENNDVSKNDEHFESITTGESLDVIEMDAASNRGIEDIRSLKESINYLPAVLKYKVYIIDEAHMLTKEAFNALLKTLEEPPSHVIFILATTEPHKIPITILSRVVRFDFTLADKASLKNKIDHIAKSEKIKISEDAFNKIYKISGGSYRDSESLIAKLSSHGKDINLELVERILGIPSSEQIEEFLDLLGSGSIKELIQYIDQLEDNNIDFKLFVEEILEYLLEDFVKSGSVVKENFSLFSEILSNIDSFNNQGLYLRSKLISSSSNVATNGTQKIHDSVGKVEVKTDVISSNAKKKTGDDGVKQKKHTKTMVSNELNIGTFLEMIGESDPRLEAVLEASDISLEEEVLMITNEFQFNIKYISKDKCLKCIKNVLKDLLGKDVDIKTIQGKVEANEKVSKIETTIENQAIEKPEKKKQEDNSNLVEELI